MTINISVYDRQERGKLCFVHMTPDEALALIASLAQQVSTGNPNSCRLESHCYGDFTDFTIAVLPKVLQS